ncbi:hypothetical protein FLW53_25770 [Microbispora sp. SCL1-1]|uniref:hypothetical protein n=1 Tax=Microbispora TaxID=2005 RepID=UPI00115919C9|nr:MULTISPECIES: hypothetical protein [unclassified Microbispora]NJP27557.1 hypothetical protein [Microbispora sp. CL1-1]TQS10813.1 hypothetical protein FLW53_25770 [Microbispora sp. SCL1-1]
MMRRLADLLDGLRCSCCQALDVLWLDPRGLVECHECGQKAAVIVDGLGPSDLLDPLNAWDGDR